MTPITKEFVMLLFVLQVFAVNAPVLHMYTWCLYTYKPLTRTYQYSIRIAGQTPAGPATAAAAAAGAGLPRPRRVSLW